ncbi:MAG: hypothetical protein JW798_07625 [Prolixibacteraceae bacterium]|nr:hypothetical protein [Prolixibacteraceae bacterium]
MKTKYLLMVLIAAFVTATGFATEKPQMTISTNDALVASIRFESPVPTLFEMTIQNEQGEIMYYKKSGERTGQYNHQFDFSGLNAGKYLVCVNYGNQSLNRELLVSSEKIIISPVEFCYEPYFSTEGGKLNVSFLNVAQKEVYLTIYQKGKLVYGMYLGKDMIIQKRLDLNQLEKQEYEVVLRERFKKHSAYVQL